MTAKTKAPKKPRTTNAKPALDDADAEAIHRTGYVYRNRAGHLVVISNGFYGVANVRDEKAVSEFLADAVSGGGVQLLATFNLPAAPKATASGLDASAMDALRSLTDTLRGFAEKALEADESENTAKFQTLTAASSALADRAAKEAGTFSALRYASETVRRAGSARDAFLCYGAAMTVAQTDEENATSFANASRNMMMDLAERLAD